MGFRWRNRSRTDGFPPLASMILQLYNFSDGRNASHFENSTSSAMARVSFDLAVTQGICCQVNKKM